MKKALTVLALILLIAAASANSGCQDAKNMDDEAHVLSLGIDVGKDRRFKFTVQIPSQTASKATKGGFTIHSAEADSIYEAIDMINTSLPWRLNFMQLNFIAFSKELADQGYIREFMRPSPRHLGFRTTCSVIITKDSAGAFLDGMHGQNDINLAKQQRTWALEPTKSALFPECTYINLAESLNNPIYCALVPVGAVNANAEATQEREKEAEEAFSDASEESDEQTEMTAGETIRESVNTSEMMGSIILDGGKPVATLDANETLLLMLARNQFEQGWYFYTDEEHTVANLKLASPRKITLLSREPLKMRLEIFLKGDLETGLGTDVFKDEESVTHIESTIEQSIHDEMQSLFDRCKALGVDAFELGKGAIMNFATNREWSDYNWIEKYRQCELEIRVKFKLNRYNVTNEQPETGALAKPEDGAGKNANGATGGGH